MFYNNTIKTMDSNLISGKRFLFALSIIDGALDDWAKERRMAMILSITEIKEEILKEYHPPKATENIPQKYQNNRGSQNNGKVSI